MQSIQSRLFLFALRNRNFFRTWGKKERWDLNTSVAEFRQRCEDGAKKAGNLPAGIEAVPVTIPGLPAGLSAEWIQPVGSTSDAVIFYAHGGGYVSGSCSDHRVFVAKFVQKTGLRLLLFEYRLAPEHTFPAALDDSLTAYHWLLDSGVPASRIIIAGESAGGGLALSTLVALRDQGQPLPAAVVALSPWTDLKITGESHRTKANVCLSPLDMAKVCGKYFAGDTDLGHPWMSPLYSDLHGLPPLFISVGDDETLRDDSTRFAAKALAAGVNVTLRVGPGMVHCYPLFAPLFPEATQALDEICTFIINSVPPRA